MAPILERIVPAPLVDFSDKVGFFTVRSEDEEEVPLVEFRENGLYHFMSLNSRAIQGIYSPEGDIVWESSEGIFYINRRILESRGPRIQFERDVVYSYSTGEGHRFSFSEDETPNVPDYGLGSRMNHYVKSVSGENGMIWQNPRLN